MKSLKDLQGQNIVVFDLEIKKTISKESGVGWRDFDKMGISVGCLYDFQTGDSHVYLDDNLIHLASRLLSAKVVVGFNILQFDLPLLYATVNMPKVQDHCVYDLLKEVRVSTGQALPKGCNLNEVLKATFGMEKTEDGADAPLFYQKGEMGKLITYCLADVRRERMVLEQAYLKGYVSTATHGQHPMRNCLDLL